MSKQREAPERRASAGTLQLTLFTCLSESPGTVGHGSQRQGVTNGRPKDWESGRAVPLLCNRGVLTKWYLSLPQVSCTHLRTTEILGGVNEYEFKKMIITFPIQE